MRRPLQSREIKHETNDNSQKRSTYDRAIESSRPTPTPVEFLFRIRFYRTLPAGGLFRETLLAGKIVDGVDFTLNYKPTTGNHILYCIQ